MAKAEDQLARAEDRRDVHSRRNASIIWRPSGPEARPEGQSCPTKCG